MTEEEVRNTAALKKFITTHTVLKHASNLGASGKQTGRRKDFQAKYTEMFKIAIQHHRGVEIMALPVIPPGCAVFRFCPHPSLRSEGFMFGKPGVPMTADEVKRWNEGWGIEYPRVVIIRSAKPLQIPEMIPNFMSRFGVGAHILDPPYGTHPNPGFKDVAPSKDQLYEHLEVLNIDYNI